MQPIKQIFAETPVRYRSLQIPMRGRNDANIDGDSLRPAATAVIQKCLDTQKRADGLYASRAGLDYQLLKAEEALNCDLGK